MTTVPRWGVLSSVAAPVLLIGGWTLAARLQPGGFDSVTERAIFQRLLGATGLGPRLALAILSTLGPERAVRSIQGKDVPAPGRGRPADEAAKALLALGYAPAVADEAVRAALAEARTDDVAALVRRALQQLTTPRGGRG